MCGRNGAGFKLPRPRHLSAGSAAGCATSNSFNELDRSHGTFAAGTGRRSGIGKGFCGFAQSAGTAGRRFHWVNRGDSVIALVWCARTDRAVGGALRAATLLHLRLGAW